MSITKLKIVAVVNTEFTNTFDTLYREASLRNDLEFIFVVIPLRLEGSFKYSIPMQKIEKMMERKNYSFIKGYNPVSDSYLDLKELSPDAVFLQSPYDVHRYSPLYSSYYISSFAACYHISYGCSLLDYDKPPYDFLVRNFQPSCIILNENSMLANYLNKYHKNVPIGYLKCDKYLNYVNDNYFFKLNRPKYKTILCWKPRWVGTLGDSNFIRYIDFFLDYTAHHKDTLLYIVMHDFFEEEITKRRQIYTKKEYQRLLQKIDSIKNIKIIAHDDFLDYVFASDIFIGDYCSTILEFFLSKKPVIYCPTEVYFSDFGKQVSTGFYTVSNISELKDTIEQLVIKKIDPLKPIRENLVGLVSDKHEGYTIAQYLINYLINNVEFDKKYCRNFASNHKNSTESRSKNNISKLSIKNKIRYFIWRYLNKKLKEKHII